MNRLMLIALLAGSAFPVIGGAAEAARERIAEGTTGTITGTIEHLEKGKVTVNDGTTTLVVMPRWKGGMPKDGGGFDKEVLRRLELFKVGDRVTVAWTFAEHHRIDRIEKAAVR